MLQGRVKIIVIMWITLLRIVTRSNLIQEDFYRYQGGYLQQLAYGKKLASSDDDNATQFVSCHNHGRNRARRRFYHIEKHDSTRSIPSKSIAQSNLCDMQIQPSVSTSALIQCQDNKNYSVSSSSSSYTLPFTDRDLRTGKVLWKTDTVLILRNALMNLLSTTPQSLIALFLHHHSSLAVVQMSQKEHWVLWSSTLWCILIYEKVDTEKDFTSTLWLMLTARQQIKYFWTPTLRDFCLLRTSMEGLSYSQIQRNREPEGSNTGYRVTLSGTNSNSPDILHRINNSNRCMIRSHQRRKIQLQKNILGNLGGSKKAADRNSNVVLRAYKKAHEPVKVCLKKNLIDLLWTNSSNSVSESKGFWNISNWRTRLLCQ